MSKEKPEQAEPGVFTEAAQMARQKYADAQARGASVKELATLRDDLLRLTDQAYRAQILSEELGIPTQQDEHPDEWPPKPIETKK